MHSTPPPPHVPSTVLSRMEKPATWGGGHIDRTFDPIEKTSTLLYVQ
jgi:hypothetical protein